VRHATSQHSSRDFETELRELRAHLLAMGARMTCLDGYWEFDDEVANCPAEP
jgi:hypothetical protein